MNEVVKPNLYRVTTLPFCFNCGKSLAKGDVVAKFLSFTTHVECMEGYTEQMWADLQVLDIISWTPMLT